VKVWYTASELEELALPTLKLKRRGISYQAQRDGWKSRTVKAKGAGRPKVEYHVDSLPAAAQSALTVAAANVTPTEIAVPDSDTRRLKKSQRDVLEARLVLLQYVNQQVLLARVTVNAAIDELVETVNAGVADAELLHFARVANARGEKLSRRSLFRWRKQAEAGQVALAPKPMPEADVPEWADALIQLWGTPSQPSLSQCVEALQAELPAGKAPSYDQARRFKARLDAISLNKGRMGPRELKSMKAYVKRSVDDLWPTAIYSSDGHTADFEVAHPKHGRPFRPEITSIIDIYTRRLVGWSAGLAEATWGTLDAMRHAFTTAGVCTIWYVDRGKGFNNDRFDNQVTGFLSRFGITKTNSLPYNSQARGVIERVHQSLWIREGRTLPTYVGRDMDREAAHRAHKLTRREVAEKGGSSILMTWSDFLAWAQAAVDSYNARPHSALGKIRDAITGRNRHMSPDEAWSKALQTGFEADVVDAGDHDLFRPYERRKVSRALISLFGHEYFAAELEPWHGEEVLVGYDIHDGATVYVRTLDHQFICTAERDAHARPYMPASMLERAADLRAKGRLNRLGRQIEEVQAERDGMLLDYQPATPVQIAMPAEQIEAARAKLAQLEQPRQPVAPANSNGVPNFQDGMAGNLEFITWLMANPHEVNEQRLQLVRSDLRRRTARMYMEAVRFDIEAVERFVAEHTNTLGKQEEVTRYAASVL